MLIGRKNEIEQLHKLCDINKSSLTVVHGRRRIGKTYLIDKMFKDHRKDCIFFDYTGSYDQDSKTQIKNFVESIYDWFKFESTSVIEDWTDAFILLKKAIVHEIVDKQHNGKVVIFIDEVSWIDKTNKNNFLSSLGHFWNTFCEKNGNVVMILCGSNASWIKNKILKDTKGPLYKRIDTEIAMKPFTLKETKQYLLNIGFDIDDKNITELYIVMGGVAKYLTYLDSTLSIAENIDKLFFNTTAPLFGEYDLIFKTLFYDRHTYHKKIVDMLCTKQSGYTTVEMASILEVESSNTTLRTALDELTDTGFIKPISKFNQKSKDAKYIVADPFCIFYTKWVKPLSKNDISSLNDYWSSIVGTQSYAIWNGFTFEAVCIINIELYLRARGLQGAYKNVSYWNHLATSKEDKGAQIDFVVEYDNNVYDIVECKYYNDEFTITKDYADILKNKVNKFKEYGIKLKSKYDLKLVMLTTFGTKRNQHYNSANVVKDITLSELLD